jgi:hypothetical protein
MDPVADWKPRQARQRVPDSARSARARSRSPTRAVSRAGPSSGRPNNASRSTGSGLRPSTSSSARRRTLPHAGRGWLLLIWVRQSPPPPPPPSPPSPGGELHLPRCSSRAARSSPEGLGTSAMRRRRAARGALEGVDRSTPITRALRSAYFPDNRTALIWRRGPTRTRRASPPGAAALSLGAPRRVVVFLRIVVRRASRPPRSSMT